MAITTAEQFRIEEDALGYVQVPAEHLWRAQTQLSHINFSIGVERFRWGRPVIRALGTLKKSAALANGELGRLPIVRKAGASWAAIWQQPGLDKGTAQRAFHSLPNKDWRRFGQTAAD